MNQLTYFAYGSNMDEQQMAARCPGARVIGRARLDGWRLVFRGVADIEERSGAEVYGVLWSVTRFNLAQLDRYEGYPWLYRRFTVDVTTDDGATDEAIVYVMNDDSEQSLPSPFYLDGVLEGVRDHRIPRRQVNDALYRASKFLKGRGVTKVRISGKRTFPVDGPSRKMPRRLMHRDRKVTERAHIDAPSPRVRLPRTTTSGMSPATRLELEAEWETEPGQSEFDLVTQARLEAIALESEEFYERTTGETRTVRGRHADR